MIKASIVLAIISIVLSFIMGVLDAFPFADAANSGQEYMHVSGDSDHPAGEVVAVSNQFSLCYRDIIEDIASFQDNPSLERANARKEAFTGYAEELKGSYEGFAEDLSRKLDTVAIPFL